MYKGIESTSIDNYIFDTLPYNPEINISKVRNIESCLRNYVGGYVQKGIGYEDAITFLNWLTYNARTAATSNIPESAMSAPLTGTCAPTQRINKIILEKIGLQVNPFNMENCIEELPKTNEDEQRIKDGYLSNNVRHAVTIVKIPILENGTTKLHTFLLDPTFRQFCLKENCNRNMYWNQEKIQKGHVAPHPGYFLSKQYLEEKGEDSHKIEMSRYVADVLINRGFMELTEETAKIYGDAFAKSGLREQFKEYSLKRTGTEYINSFEKNTVKKFFGSQFNEFTKTPLEIREKLSFLDKIKNMFRINKTKKLTEGISEQLNTTTDGHTRFVNKYKDEGYEYPNLSKYNQNVMQQTVKEPEEKA